MLDLTNHFSKVFVINLDIRPDRWQEFSRRADLVGVGGFTRFSAIEGDKCPHPAWWRAGNGAWGCLMSHFMIAQQALMDGLDNYLVFEDDAVLSKDFPDRLPRIMSEVAGLKGEWDMLYLGGQHLYVETSPPWPFREGIVRSPNINRTHAYAVNARFMVKFYQHILHAPDYINKTVKPVEADEAKGIEEVREWCPHIDHQLGDLHRHITTLAADPWLCGQAASSSNVSGQKTTEEWWNDKGWGV